MSPNTSCLAIPRKLIVIWTQVLALIPSLSGVKGMPCHYFIMEAWRASPPSCFRHWCQGAAGNKQSNFSARSCSMISNPWQGRKLHPFKRFYKEHVPSALVFRIQQKNIHSTDTSDTHTHSRSLSLSLSLSLTHTHTHILSLSLSLSLIHTHTHTIAHTRRCCKQCHEKSRWQPSTTRAPG